MNLCLKLHCQFPAISNNSIANTRNWNIGFKIQDLRIQDFWDVKDLCFGLKIPRVKKVLRLYLGYVFRTSKMCGAVFHTTRFLITNLGYTSAVLGKSHSLNAQRNSSARMWQIPYTELLSRPLQHIPQLYVADSVLILITNI